MQQFLVGFVVGASIMTIIGTLAIMLVAPPF